MSQVSCDDSFLRFPRLIFLRQQKAAKEIHSQTQWHLPSKKSNSLIIGSWREMFSQWRQKVFPVLLVMLCLLRPTYTNFNILICLATCAKTLQVKRPRPSHCLQMPLFLRLVEFLHNDHLAKPWGAAAWDNNRRATAGVSVHAWGRAKQQVGRFYCVLFQ